MPRIDPVKLLSCIGVLLSPNGGIRSAIEVKRLAGLMSKYSKKLVSKCIYIQILKCTETELLGNFMTVGGWTLVHSWLADGIDSKNWSLVQELLELLLLCPVDVPRLQSNSAPKLVKGLSREEENEGVRILATRLVEQWLKIARGEISSQNSNVFNKENLLDSQSQIIVKPVQMFSDQGLDNADDLNTVDGSLCVSQINDNDVTDCTNDMGEPGESESLVFKITMKDGKQTVAKINDSSPKKNGNRTNDSHKDSDSDERTAKRSDKSRDERKSDDSRLKDGKERDKSKDHHDKHKKSVSSSSNHRSSSSSKSSTSKHGSSSNSSKSSSSHSKSHKSSASSSNNHKSSSSSSSSSSNRDKHKSSSSTTSSKTSSSSSSKDKKSDSSKTQAEKDKDTLAKIQPKSLEKVGKIPKKSSASEGASDPTKKPTDAAPTIVPKKKSISIEVRKDTENRPKTVKTYNSQFRSHGLAEEAPPPPSRRDLKKPTSVPTNGIPVAPKRSLSPTNTAKEFEKKIKLSTSPTIEKPGAIKLIPAKPKPSVLIESDMFMDAISAATTKKEVRKRKRIPSAKESETTSDKMPTTKDNKEPTKAVTAAPLRFYQDTLEESDNKDEPAKCDTTKKEIDASDEGETKDKRIKTEDDANEEQNGEKQNEDTSESPEEPVEDVKREPGPGCGPDGPPGVLTLHRRKGPKKSLRWKPQEALEEVRFFELDETERVNVTKAFVDMKQMEHVSEREAFLIGRKGNEEDVMTEQIPWVQLILVDDVPEYAVKSKEKEVQAEREKTCLKTIYFNRAMIPDSPLEPDVIAFQNVEPPTIPLFDITGNTDAIHDYTNMPWPEAKGSPPHQAGNLEDMNGISNFGAFGQFNNLNNMNWPAQNNMMGVRPPQLGLIMPQDAINPMNMNPMHAFNAQNMTPMMGQLPPFINNFGPGIPPMMNNNQGNRGNNWFGAGGNNNAANNNWPAQGQNNNNNNNNNNSNSNQRNNWIQNRRVCKQFQRGFCRHGKNCKFLHPGENSGPKF